MTSSGRAPRGGQSELFTRAEDGRAGAEVQPAAFSDELRALADALPPDLWLGTSSWSFPGWAGLVYDREYSERRLAREGLGAYARHPLARAVGIDRSYHAVVPQEAFADYAARLASRPAFREAFSDVGGRSKDA